MHLSAENNLSICRIFAENNKVWYYAVLQTVQHTPGDITEWLAWFLQCLKNALIETDRTLQNVLRKAAFWQLHEHTPLNERQRLVLNKLLLFVSISSLTGRCQPLTKTKLLTATADRHQVLLRESAGW